MAASTVGTCRRSMRSRAFGRLDAHDRPECGTLAVAWPWANCSVTILWLLKRSTMPAERSVVPDAALGNDDHARHRAVTSFM